jgi:hypothetical protein
LPWKRAESSANDLSKVHPKGEDLPEGGPPLVPLAAIVSCACRPSLDELLLGQRAPQPCH